MAKEKNTSAQKNAKQQPKTTLKRTQVKHHPLKTTYNFASEVKKHSKTQYTQNFSSYTDIYGAEDLDYDLIDGLYHSTILNRVIRKISADAVPEMFKIQVVDLEGNRIPDIEQACFAYTANLKRTHIKSYFTQTLKYGTGFLYIGNKEEDQLTNMFLLHPKDLKPVMDESTGEIAEWTYTTQDGDITIPDEDLVRFPYDADIGEVFGMSFMGKLVHTLHLMLNTELNLAEIVDKYAIPILQWLIEIGDDEELQEDELEGIVRSLQEQLEYSNDVVTTDRIKTDTIGFDEHQYDMVTTLQALKESFGLLTFPMALIGGKSDNLSSIKVQSSQYVYDLRDLQIDLADVFIEQIYEPFIRDTLGKIPGVDYANIYLVFPVLTAEGNADASVWIFQAIKFGLITREEARAQLSFRGVPVPVEEIEFPDNSLFGGEGDNVGPSAPKDRSGQHDPDDNQGDE